jgi:hypothetical protein
LASSSDRPSRAQRCARKARRRLQRPARQAHRARRALRRIPPLWDYLAKIEDPRSRRGKRHPLVSVLALLVVALLCQQRGYRGAAQWARASSGSFKRRLGFTEFDTPAPSTFYEVLKGLSWSAVEEQTRAWSAAVLLALGTDPDHALTAVALDGKRLRGSAAAGANVAHLLAAVSHRLALTLGHQAVAAGQGERTVSEPFLEAILFPGCVLTADAGFTSRKLATQVVAEGADYVAVVKGNQPKLKAKIGELLGVYGLPRDRRRTEVEPENRHGRLANRHLLVASVEPGEVDWPGARQIFAVRRSYYHSHNGKSSWQLVYGITSLPETRANARLLLALIRGHWTIETGAFWVRDAVLGEDAARITEGNVAMNMAVCRGLVTTLLRASGCEGVAAGQREMSADKNRALRLIGV